MTLKYSIAGWSGPLGGILLSVASSLALGACSGDDSEDPAPSETPDGVTAPPAQNTGTPSDEDDADEPASGSEGNPNVTGLDDGDGASSGNGSGDTDSEAEAGGMSVDPAAAEVPDSEHCAAVADWDPEWVQFEEEVLLLVNEMRSQPADCGVEGQFDAAPPLEMDPVLRCSARLHSLDMFDRDFFDHVNPDGLDPFQRMQEAGFDGQRMGENIAEGQTTPEEVMAAWMDSDGHCSNIMLPQYTLIGIGFDPGAAMRGLGSNYWTQNFGTPFPQRRSR